jgi:hypothetical protein
MTPFDRRRSLAALAVLAGTALGAAAWRPLFAAAPATAGEPVVWPQVRLLDGSNWGAEQASGKTVAAAFRAGGLARPGCKHYNDN